ncbi:hypothetical protein C8R45DRAFT_1219727 [Mycena sanguinolenta]|nr:hypothetical protein C8R45DRAFT_1219727 [Mycena sanguinolenta]
MPRFGALPGFSAQEEILVKFFLSPWLIGSCLELVLMGVLSCQVVNYYNSDTNDGRGLPIAVAILCLLNVLKSAECFASLWIFSISHFGDARYGLRLIVTGWWVAGNSLMVAILNFYVQCYFCTRLWAVTQRWWVSAPIFAIFVFALGSMVMGTYYIETLQEQQVTDWFAAHFSSVFAGDVVLSVATAYFLIKTEKAFLSMEMAELIHSLVPLTFQTATPPAVVAMFNLIFSQMYRTNRPLLGYVLIAFNQFLPKLYAISMMYTLNARRGIRTRVASSRSDETDADVELGRIGGVTQQETAWDVHVSIERSKLRIRSPTGTFTVAEQNNQLFVEGKGLSGGEM